MRIRLVYLSLPVLLMACSTQKAQLSNDNAASKYTSEGYRLVWSDEFDTPGRPDSSKWNYEHGLVRNEEWQWYQPENARCEKGLLVIEARREEKTNPGYSADAKDWRGKRRVATYTSSCLITSGKAHWQYGRFEMRGRIDISEGLWPAWWTLGISKQWPANGEIDIMEYYRNKLLANLVCLGKEGRQEWHSNTFSTDSLGGTAWAQQFHVWRMDWTDRSIELYIDGQLLNKVPTDSLVNKDGSGFNPFKQPHYMLLNLAIGGQNGGNADNISFPRRFEVDWVRVYQQQ